MNNNQIVIIEGTEGVGKTTLINKLKEMGYKSKHFDYDKNNPDLRQKYLTIYQSATADSEQYVFDRSFMSEDVYGPVIRDGSRLSEEDQLAILSFLNDAGAAIVVLTADNSTLKQRVEERNEDGEFPLQDIFDLNKKYLEVADTYSKHCNLVVVDTTSLNAEQAVEFVISNI